MHHHLRLLPFCHYLSSAWSPKYLLYSQILEFTSCLQCVHFSPPPLLSDTEIPSCHFSVHYSLLASCPLTEDEIPALTMIYEAPLSFVPSYPCCLMSYLFLLTPCGPINMSYKWHVGLSTSHMQLWLCAFAQTVSWVSSVFLLPTTHIHKYLVNPCSFSFWVPS